MPTPRLINLLLGRSSSGPARTSQVVFEQGTVQLIQGTGRLLVATPTGGFVTASPTTDERFREGDRVWISKAQDGTYIVHGGVR